MGIVKIILGGSNYFKAFQKCSTVWFLFTSARRQLRSEQSLWMVCRNRILCVINAGYCGFDYRFICSGKPFANCFISTLFLTTPHLEKEAKKKKPMKPLWNLNWAVLPDKMAKSTDLDLFQSPWGPYLPFNHPHILFPLSKCGPTLKCPHVCVCLCHGSNLRCIVGEGRSRALQGRQREPPSPVALGSHLGYSHLGRQQKTSDNWWALWGPRVADSPMEPSLSENYIYKADGARMKETRVPDKGAPAPADSFIGGRQQLNCDVTRTHGIKIQHVCPDFTVILSPLLFSPASVSNWDETCCLFCVSQRFKITGNNLCAGPQVIFLFSSSLIVFIDSLGTTDDLRPNASL